MIPHGQHLSSIPSLTNPLQTTLLLLFLFVQCTTAQDVTYPDAEANGLSSERLSRLTEVMQEYSENQWIPGGVIQINRNGTTVYRESFGYRDRESQESMPEDAIFRIASQTKAIVSVGIMMLQEEGKLLISDRLDRYIPEFSDPVVGEPTDGDGYRLVPANRPITLRHLLTHTSGIGYGYGTTADQWEEAGIQNWYFADRDEPVLETIRRMGSLPLENHPGERYLYGYNTDILGAVIEIVSGMPLDQYLRETILDPLGMDDTHFYLPQEKVDRLAVVYHSNRERTLERAPAPGGSDGQGHYVDGPRTSFSGGAGLLSTAHDYSRFLQMLLNGGELDGVRLLSPTTLDLMTTNHIGDLFPRAGEGMGLGLYTLLDAGERGSPGYKGEFGWGGAYHSTYWVDPTNQLTVTFFTQMRRIPYSDVHGKVRALVYQSIME
ncbi:MAG: serine hydrolase domain-containing protein [Balneolaceae bacterium]